jgi:hypothetical protein
LNSRSWLRSNQLRLKQLLLIWMQLGVNSNGDPGPESAGTAGEAAL